MNTVILALDISSTHIGVCYNGEPMKTWVLPKLDIATRCYAARVRLQEHLTQYPSVDLVVFEEPVGKFAKSIIPQSSVQGAVLCLLAERNLLWSKIAPKEAKKALAGSGNADKIAMIAAASARTQLPLDEHAADAYGLWLAALGIRIEKAAA